MPSPAQSFTLLLLLLAPALSRAQASGTVAGRVAVLKEEGGAAENAVAVVSVEGPPVQAFKPGEAPRIRQKDIQFEPAITVVQAGTSVDFPNEDKIFHNVFSVSTAARFDLGLYKSGSSKTVTFNRPGTVDIFCNIHPQMVATVKVVPGPWYAVTAADGTFQIDGVPPGTWTLVAWQPSGPEYRGQITVASGKTERVSLSLTQGKKTRWHLRKDGTPYGRYK